MNTPFVSYEIREVAIFEDEVVPWNITPTYRTGDTRRHAWALYGRAPDGNGHDLAEHISDHEFFFDARASYMNITGNSCPNTCADLFRLPPPKESQS